MRDTVHLYEISDLLLDLDSEDCKQVRSISGEIDGEPESPQAKKNREHEILKSRIAQFDLEYEEDVAAFRRVRLSDLSKRRITDLDILHMALRGPSNKDLLQNTTVEDVAESRTDKLITSILDENGIPHFARSDPAKLYPYLLRRQELANKQPLSIERVKKLEKVLRQSRDLHELKRSVYQILEEPQGRQLVSRVSETIGRQLTQIADQSEPGLALESLAFINDLFLNLTEGELRIHQAFRGIGFQLAVRCNYFSTAQMYLPLEGECSVSDDQNVEHLSKSLQSLLKSLLLKSSNIENIEQSPEERQYRVAVFGLLTGEYPSRHQSQRSIYHTLKLARYTNEESKAISQAFFQILGQLGAFGTLWHLFRRHSQDHGTSLSVGEDEIVGAILLNAVNLATGRVKMADLGPMRTTGDYESDCQYDVSTIMRSEQPPAQPTVLGQSPSPVNISPDFNMTARSVDASLRKEILEVFAESTIERFAAALRAKSYFATIFTKEFFGIYAT